MFWSNLVSVGGMDGGSMWGRYDHAEDSLSLVRLLETISPHNILTQEVGIVNSFPDEEAAAQRGFKAATRLQSREARTGLES